MAFQTHTAAVLPSIGKALELREQPIPEAGIGSVVIQVLAVSLSPNVNNVFAGTFGTPLLTPITPSQTSIGRVHRVGPDATSLQPGQLVLTDFFTQSRDDPDNHILAGYMTFNESLGKVWTNGTLAQYACVPLERCWAVDESLLSTYSAPDLVYLGTLCIPLAGLIEIDVRPGDTVIVAPATGTYGGSAVPAAMALGAKVIACGRNDETLAKLAKLYPPHRLTTVKLSGDQQKDTAAIKAAAGGKGADRYIDFTPSSAAASKHPASCILALRSGGRAVLMGGVFSNIEIPYFHVLLNNIRVEGRFMLDRCHVEQALKLLQTDQLKLGEAGCGIKNHVFRFADIHKALDAAAEHRGWGHQVVVEPNA